MTALSDHGAYRARIFDAVVPVLEADATVRAIWEGGSVAMGRADAYSDIDLYVVADKAHHETLLDTLERALAQPAPIAHVWRVDPSSYAGITQRIYLLRDAPRFFMIDCALVAPDATRQFLERERHGVPRVLLDRDAAIDAPPLDRAAHAARMRTRLAQIRGAWPVYRVIVEKETTRGRALDAIGFYFNGLLRPLVELTGMLERAERFDYGWRYLHADVAPARQRQLEQLAYVADLDALRANLPSLDRIAAELFQALAAAPFAQESRAP